jgi:hypothetical protein
VSLTRIHLALRVEWCKAYARTRRWHEDIVLLEEEMRRTIEYGNWMAAEWEDQATARTKNVDAALAEGLRAYAAEHVDREKRTRVVLEKQWTGLHEKADLYLAGITTDQRAQVVIVDTTEGDPDDPEGDVVGDELVDEEDAGDDDQEDPDDV